MNTTFIARTIVGTCFVISLLQPLSSRAAEADTGTTSGGTSGQSGQGGIAADSFSGTSGEFGQPYVPKSNSSVFTYGRLDVRRFLLKTRMDDQQNGFGLTTTRNWQYGFALETRLRLDNAGKITIGTVVSTGGTFISEWTSTGLGQGSPRNLNIYVKQLFVEARPYKGIDFLIGGIGFNRGHGTDISTFDNDGYLMGERLIVKRPEQLWLDEVSVSAGYLGSLTEPSVFARAPMMGHVNYEQLMVAKKLGKRVTASADYTLQWNIGTWRQGLYVKTPEFVVANAVRLETYERPDGVSGSGFAVTGERKLFRNASTAYGFASIDPNFGGLNSDRFTRGKRLYAQFDYVLFRYVGLEAFYQHAVATPAAWGNRSRVELIASFDLARVLRDRLASVAAAKQANSN